MKRFKLSSRRSKKMFKHSSSRTHKRNLGHANMRGGIRL